MKRKTTIQRIITMFFVMSLLLIGCSKDDDAPKPKPETKMLEDYLVESGFDETSSNFINAARFEFGLVISPNVDGTINRLYIKLPGGGDNVRITIWDAETKQVLKTEYINVNEENTQYTRVIEPFEVIKDKKYLISMNSNDWYNRKKSDGSNVTYPILVENITIHEYRWAGTTVSETIFPLTIASNYYAGDIDFDFQPK